MRGGTRIFPLLFTALSYYISFVCFCLESAGEKSGSCFSKGVLLYFGWNGEITRIFEYSHVNYNHATLRNPEIRCRPAGARIAAPPARGLPSAKRDPYRTRTVPEPCPDVAKMIQPRIVMSMRECSPVTRVPGGDRKKRTFAARVNKALPGVMQRSAQLQPVCWNLVERPWPHV